MSTIAILHPGQMGAAVGRALLDVGHAVGWLPAGRGTGTHRRALAAGLTAFDAVDRCDAVISVCPPAAALETARGLRGFTGLYVDANAVSPSTARGVASAARLRGSTYVDGAVIGPPPTHAGSTRLYLSGERAADIAALFASSRLEAVVLDSDDFAASALKMTYAAQTKISTALLVSLHRAARELGVEDALLAEWARSQPELTTRLPAAQDAVLSKAWRWSDEMREISETFAAVGEPAGFGVAAAELFDRWPRPADD